MLIHEENICDPYILYTFLSDCIKMAFRIIGDAVDFVGDLVDKAVKRHCTLENDTKYPVEVLAHDGTYCVKPGASSSFQVVTGFSFDLVMKLPGEEPKINFPSSEFGNRTHKISILFDKYIRSFEIKVIGASSHWNLSFNHHGGFEVKLSSKVITKNSWRNMQESGDEAKAKVGGMIKAIENSASFKHYTKKSSVEECEEEISRGCEFTVKDACYIWQEVIVVKTNQPSPYDELTIHTAHTEKTTTPEEPPRSKLVYCK